MKILSWLCRMGRKLGPAAVVLGLVLAVARLLTPGALETYPLLNHVPLAVLSAAFLLSVLFRQWRIAQLCLLTGCVVVRVAFEFEGGTPSQESSVCLAAILLPLAAVAFTIQKDRFVLSRRGLIPLVATGVVSGTLFFLPGRPGFERLVTEVCRTWPSVLGEVWPPLPPVSLLLTLMAAVFLLVTRRGRRVGGWLFQSVLFSLAGLSTETYVGFLAAMAGAGTMLTWGVLNAAWRQAYVDELTELPGRRPLMQHLDSLGSSYSVAMVDVDHFKRFNDRLGHAVGDQVLRFVASELKAFKSGKAYRYGGEEFVIVFRRGSLKTNARQAASLCRRIAGRRFRLRGPRRPRRMKDGKRKPPSRTARTVRVTVSIGIAAWSRGRNDSGEVLKAADKAMYRAKRDGRNCVSVAPN